ncbi:MAG TPA: FAD-dependent oxidoreductase [Thermoanaerobaculia bacterium]|nr:FAD-dependent oxidoreductase [Thermoanaerobaculia bacterium]
MSLSRRDLLAAFLGAPFAAIACRKPVRRGLPPGEIVGASDRVGHRLRDGVHPSPDAWTSRDVVIVGAGIAGLAAGWRLSHAGWNDYSIFDLEPVAGGTARSGRNTVSAYPWGAHYVPAPLPENRVLIRLLGEMGVMDGNEVAEQYLCRDPQERVFYRGGWYEGLYLSAGATHEDIRQLHEFEREIDRWVAMRAFKIPTALASKDAEVLALDRMSAAQWLDAHRWTSPRLRWLVAYACRDDYGATLEDTSAWAAVFYFASRVPAPGKPSQPLITWPEGNGRFVRYLSNDRVETGWLVTSVIPADGGIDVIALSRDGAHARGIHAKHVIFAAPQFIAARVIRDYRDVRDFVYGSWLVANLTVSKPPAPHGFPLCWDNVLYESPALGYVVATHQTNDSGPTVLTYYYAFTDHDPRVARERLLSAGRDEWAEVVLSDLSRAHPDIRDITQRLDVMRWGHAMIRPSPGFITSAARDEAAQPFRNIEFANTDLSGVALFEESLYHGVRAAEAVLSRAGRTVETYL